MFEVLFEAIMIVAVAWAAPLWRGMPVLRPMLKSATGLRRVRSLQMPRYFFHLHEDVTVVDEKGVDLPNFEVALERAAKEVRQIAGAIVQDDGVLVLDNRLEIADEHGPLHTMLFKDVIEVRQQ